MNANQTFTSKRTRSFEDLQIWQRSMELAEEVCRLTRSFPREELFCLTSQLRRSAVSIPSNIAEGYGRLNRREFKRFLLIARGSCCELKTQLRLAGNLGYGSRKPLDQAAAKTDEVGKMIFSMLEKLKTTV